MLKFFVKVSLVFFIQAFFIVTNTSFGVLAEFNEALNNSLQTEAFNKKSPHHDTNERYHESPSTIQNSYKKRVQYLQQSHPIDVNDPFTALLSTNTFIDKSLFLKELLCTDLEYRWEPISVIRPPRTGKSIMLSMLKKFLELEIDQQGNALPDEERVNRKLFTGGQISSKVFRKLKIAEHEDAMAHQGKFPVVLLNFTDVTGSTYKEIEEKLIHSVRVAINQHVPYLKNYYDASKNSTYHFQNQQRLVNGLLKSKHHTKLTTITVTNDMFVLTEALSNHFKERVYVLIDNYDKPITEAFVKFGKKSKQLNDVFFVIQTLFQMGLRDNQYVKRGVLTGTQPIPLTFTRAGFNNILDYNQLHVKFSQYFGIVQEEVDQLLAKIPTQTHPDQIKDTYNGYNINTMVIYNTHSVIQCLAGAGKVDDFWIKGQDTSFMDTVFNSDEMQTGLGNFTEKNGVLVSVEEYIDLMHPWSAMLHEKLLYQGYLNAVHASDSFGLWPKYHLIIPNQEVRKIYLSQARKSR